MSRWGRIDVVVCNAGGSVGLPGVAIGPTIFASTLDPRELDLIIRRNLIATVATCVAVAPAMKAQRSGSIVTLGSVNGIEALRSGASAHYGAAKAAVIMYTRYLAQELGPFGVRANCLLPGVTVTGRMQSNFGCTRERSLRCPGRGARGAERDASSHADRRLHRWTGVPRDRRVAFLHRPRASSRRRRTARPDMKLGLYGACLGAMASAESVHAAQLAERLGYESLWTGEHMALPDPQVPPSHRDPKHPFFDPIVGMTYLAAHTSSIRLGLGILILAQRHPVQLAKELTTLDILSNGRLIVGVGVGYLEAEYRAVGVDFRTRAARCNEHLEALRTLWSDEPPRYEGRFVTIDGVNAYPRPSTPGGPPLTIGGHADAALRRALRYGSGWIGFNQDLAGTRALVQRLRALAAEGGTDLDAFEITVGTRVPLDRDVVAEFADAGVDRLIVTAEGDTIADVETIIEHNAPENLLAGSAGQRNTARVERLGE